MTRLIDTLPVDFVRELLGCWRDGDFDLTAFLGLLRRSGIDGLEHETATDRMMAEVFAINHPQEPAPVPATVGSYSLN